MHRQWPQTWGFCLVWLFLPPPLLRQRTILPRLACNLLCSLCWPQFSCLSSLSPEISRHSPPHPSENSVSTLNSWARKKDTVSEQGTKQCLLKARIKCRDRRRTGKDGKDGRVCGGSVGVHLSGTGRALGSIPQEQL